jgi:hypothetical protein
MQLDILKIKKLTFTILLLILFTFCEKKSNLENQITVKINSIDGITKKSRVNIFDTIDVRVTKYGIPMQKYVKIAEYITDSSGSVKIKIDPTKEYRFIIGGKYIYGSANFTEAFTKEKLKNEQEINIEVISTDNN